ncbi:EAL domain-containing protein [Microbacterium sp. BK668]|uniref:EAL domain-containing protein n=1 Tax=Microbacterium sp. BK668 TaxID=2512118 RepID=UPI00105E8BA2|nr:EAL domain-containing protein [Microbacterium sp. BK668]TDN91403.1 EAL domain-containing protein (putative c-di-GMP-specific phosphodiesterase class I) [Microbacterium sp. BK668]
MTSSATLSAELREAVTTGGLTVEYQPLFALAEAGVPAHPVAVEALCRWTHPLLGRIVPDEFIPLAEQAGLIGDIGASVLETAGAQVSRWQHQGHHLGLSINASPSQFSPEFVARVAARAGELGLLPGSLTIEITEAPAPQLLPRVVEVLPLLQGSGIGISIDDYGAGEVELDALERVPIQEVKIDRSLSQRADAGADADVAAVVRRARRHGWRVVAEGIETVEDLERARSRGCDLGQGFLLGRPIPADEMDRILSAR